MEDEVRRYNYDQNRELQFQPSKINDDITHLKSRISMAKDEANMTEENPYLIQYLLNLKRNLKNY